jgi:hypothetical protein
MISSHTDQLKQGTAVRDGDHDATLFELDVRAAGVTELIAHELGRPVVQYAVVGSSASAKLPRWAIGNDGHWINDRVRVGLIFDAAGTYRLRFC